MEGQEGVESTPQCIILMAPLKVIFLVIFLLTHRGPRGKLGIYKVVLTFKLAFVGRTVHISNQGGGIHPSPNRVKDILIQKTLFKFYFILKLLSIHNIGN